MRPPPLPPPDGAGLRGRARCGPHAAAPLVGRDRFHLNHCWKAVTQRQRLLLVLGAEWFMAVCTAETPHGHRLKMSWDEKRLHALFPAVPVVSAPLTLGLAQTPSQGMRVCPGAARQRPPQRGTLQCFYLTKKGLSVRLSNSQKVNYDRVCLRLIYYQ